MAIQMTSTSLPESEGLTENGIAPLTSHNECLRADEIERVGSFLDHPEAPNIHYIQLIYTRKADLSHLFLYST